MDLKTRRKQLTAVAHTKKSTKDTGAKSSASDSPTALSKDRSASFEPLPIIQRDGSLISTINNLESLTKDFEIGPANHRFRLIRRLGIERESRVWLATAPNKDITDKAYYRALKIFALRDYNAETKTVKAGNNQTPRADFQNLLRMSLSRFKARCEIITLFNHLNIVKVYGWRQGEDGWPFVEMEFLDPRTGQNLARLLHLEGTPGLDWQRTLELLRPIAAALDYAHREHRLAHRNLKPENVFITEQGVVKLLDFGLTY